MKHTAALGADHTAIRRHLQSGDIEALETACRDTLAQDRGNQYAFTVLSALLLDNRRYSDAESINRERIAVAPADATAHRDLGMALYHQRLIAEAEICFRRAIALDDELSGAHYGLGLILEGKRRFAEAERAFLRTLEREPRHPAATLKLAQVLYRQDKYGAAIDMLYRLTDITSEFAEGHFWLGSALRLQERYDEALAAFRRAAELSPALAEKIVAMGIALDESRSRDHAADTLYAFYDLGEAPLTFNFVHFLILADMARAAAGLSQLHLIFVPGPQDGFGSHMSNNDYLGQAGKEWRLHNMLVPLCRLMPTCRGITICASRAETRAIEETAAIQRFPADYQSKLPPALEACARSFSLLSVVEKVRQGVAPSFLRATSKGLDYVAKWQGARASGRRLIVITLRQQEYMPARNSDLTVWADFARSLDPTVYYPVLVRDTETLYLPPSHEIRGIPEMPEATMNVEIRAALYESSYAALISEGGPSTLLYHNDRTRYCMFRKIKADEQSGDWAQFFQKVTGLQSGDQFPWAKPYQRLSDRADTPEAIREEFEALVAAIEAAE